MQHKRFSTFFAAFVATASLGFSGCQQAATTSAQKPAHSAAPKTSCDAASLAMAPDAVVAKIGADSVTAKDLGDELKAAEDKALRTYCESVATARKAALDAHVDDVLLKAEAKKAGKEVEAYVQEVVAAAAKAPTDEEIAAYYNARKNAQAPALEQVKMQVVQMMMRERQIEAFQAHIKALRAKTTVAASLPDVRPPALTFVVDAATGTAGPADAKVTVVEFSDFECPYCSRAATTMDALKKKFGDKVRFVYKHFPLSFHPNAKRAAEYAHCAQAQGKFWQMHDGIFAAQSALSEAKFAEIAQGAGADMDKLRACLADPATGARVQADFAEGERSGVRGTPSFFVNGRAHAGAPDVASLTAAIEAELN